MPATGNSNAPAASMTMSFGLRDFSLLAVSSIYSSPKVVFHSSPVGRIATSIIADVAFNPANCVSTKKPPGFQKANVDLAGLAPEQTQFRNNHCTCTESKVGAAKAWKNYTSWATLGRPCKSV